MGAISEFGRRIGEIGGPRILLVQGNLPGVDTYKGFDYSIHAEALRAVQPIIDAQAQQFGASARIETARHETIDEDGATIVSMDFGIVLRLARRDKKSPSRVFNALEASLRDLASGQEQIAQRQQTTRDTLAATYLKQAAEALE